MVNRRLVAVWSLTGLLIGTLSGFAQSSQPSLAEVARKEAERRKAVAKTAKVYTNDDTKSGGRLLTTAAARPAPSPGAADRSGAAPAAGAEAKEDPKVAALNAEMLAVRIDELRSQIARTEQAGTQMKGQIQQIEAAIVNTFDQAQRDALVSDRDGRIASHRQLEADLAELQRQLAQLEADTRRGGQQPRP